MNEQVLKAKEYEQLVKLDGRISDLEIQHLSWLGSQVPDCGTVVEIGSYRGKSICAIGCGVRHAAHEADLVAVDLWMKGLGITASKRYSLEKTLKSFKRQVRGLSLKVKRMMMSSRDARAEWGDVPIDLLFIDGGHQYASVKLDYDSWHGLVKVGGRIAFHDFGTRFKGVDRTIREALEEGKWEDVHVYGRIWSAIRCAEIATSGRAPSSQ